MGSESDESGNDQDLDVRGRRREGGPRSEGWGTHEPCTARAGLARSLSFAVHASDEREAKPHWHEMERCVGGMPAGRLWKEKTELTA